MTRSKLALIVLNAFWIVLLIFALLIACGVNVEATRPPYTPPPVTPVDPSTSYDADVGPIFAANCAGGGCHGSTPFPYDAAKAKNAEIVRRIKIPDGQAGHMPLGKPSLSPNLIAVIEQWGRDGFPKGGGAPVPRPTPARLLGDDVCFASTAHALSKNAAVRPNLRYLTITHLDDTLQGAFLANKLLNSLSSARPVVPLEAVNGSGGSVFGIDISELNLSVVAWDRVAQVAALESVFDIHHLR